MRERESADEVPVRVFPETEVVEAARLMRERGVSALLVSNGDEIVGILTERDIVARSVAEDNWPYFVGSIMTPLVSSGARQLLRVVSVDAGSAGAADRPA